MSLMKKKNWISFFFMSLLSGIAAKFHPFSCSKHIKPEFSGAPWVSYRMLRWEIRTAPKPARCVLSLRLWEPVFFAKKSPTPRFDWFFTPRYPPNARFSGESQSTPEIKVPWVAQLPFLAKSLFNGHSDQHDSIHNHTKEYQGLKTPMKWQTDTYSPITQDPEDQYRFADPQKSLLLTPFYQRFHPGLFFPDLDKMSTVVPSLPYCRVLKGAR